MYLWKCWRDTRWFLLVFIVIAALPMPVAAFATRFRTGIVDAGSFAVQSTFSLIVTVVACAVATVCSIPEFTEKTAHFLFTKPRSRAYFVWMSCLIGFLELLLVGGVNLFIGWLVLAHYRVRFFSAAGPFDNTPQAYVKAAMLAVLVYALTYALAVILRNGLRGLGASLGTLAGFSGVVETVQLRWNVRLPLPAQQIAKLPLAASELIWLLVALSFVWAAQSVVERAEL